MMHSLLYLFFSMFSCSPQENVSAVTENYFLVPFRQGDKWGLSDTLGNINLKAQYDDIIDMSIEPSRKQSFYYFRKDKRTVLIDHTGKSYLSEYDSISKDYILYQNGKAGLYFDLNNAIYNKPRNFSVILKPEYDRIEKAEIENQYIISKDGKSGVVSLSYEGAYSFILPVAYDSIVKTGNNLTGYNSGEVAAFNKTEPETHHGNDIDGPLYPETVRDRSAEKQRLISNLQKDAAPEDIKKMLPFDITPYNLYLLYRENGKKGILSFIYDLNDVTRPLIKKIIVPAVYDDVQEISPDKYLVRDGKKYGIAGINQVIKVPLVYDDIGYFKGSNDFLLLKKADKYAVYSNGRGSNLTDFEYDNYQFIPSLDYKYYVILDKNGKKSVMDSSGRISDAAYDECTLMREEPIYEGKAYVREFMKVRKGNKYGVIETREKKPAEVPVEFDDVSLTQVGYYSTFNRGLRGAFSAKNHINIPPNYKSIKYFKVNSLQGNRTIYFFEGITQNGIKIIIDQKGKEFYSK